MEICQVAQEKIVYKDQEETREASALVAWTVHKCICFWVTLGYFFPDLFWFTQFPKHQSSMSPKAFTLDERYLFTTTPPDLERGIAPLGPPVPAQPPLLGRGVAPPNCSPWPRAWGSSSWPPPLTSDLGQLLSAVPAPSQPGTLSCCPDLGRGATLLGRCPSGMGSSRLLPLTSDVGQLLLAELCVLLQPQRRWQ